EGTRRLAAGLAAAAQARAAERAALFGITSEGLGLDQAQLHRHVAHVVAALAPNDSAARLRALGVTLLSGPVRFRSRRSVAIADTIVSARRFLVATGGRPARPALLGLDQIETLTPDGVFALPRLPERPIVLGGTTAAVEIAQAAQTLGSQVTLVAPEGLLPQEDPEAVALLRRALLRAGIALHENSAVLRAELLRRRPRLVLAGDAGGAELAIDGSHLVLATGTVPAIDDLDIDLAGLARDADGIVVDRGLRSANRRVYAVGGCAGGAATGSAAPFLEQHQAVLAIRNALFRLPVRLGSQPLPRLVRTDPEIASVGASEAQARDRGAIGVLRWPYAENERAQAEGRSEGFVKLVTDGRGRVLGATIAGASAGELIAPWGLAIGKRLGAGDVAALALPPASLSEISQRAALSRAVPLANRPGIRRLIGFLRRFG
ncbi:FAD-dependent oxidoreductase, partial [Bosea sp. TWI1241]|uniref:FAD-dependent oxidoreductase n=1 Tax=Bosea sp. TWI1241 TaxID=3148904 RepID=UPI0032078BC7